jgi:hypothetical protein
MNLLLILLVFLCYAAEGWLSCKRLLAFRERSPSFIVWDTLLVVLPFSALEAWQSVSKLSVILAAASGSITGAISSGILKR